MVIGGQPALAERPPGVDMFENWKFCFRHVLEALKRNYNKFSNDTFPHQHTRSSPIIELPTTQEWSDDFHALVSSMRVGHGCNASCMWPDRVNVPSQAFSSTFGPCLLRSGSAVSQNSPIISLSGMHGASIQKPTAHQACHWIQMPLRAPIDGSRALYPLLDSSSST